MKEKVFVGFYSHTELTMNPFTFFNPEARFIGTSTVPRVPPGLYFGGAVVVVESGEVVVLREAWMYTFPWLLYSAGNLPGYEAAVTHLKSLIWYTDFPGTPRPASEAGLVYETEGLRKLDDYKQGSLGKTCREIRASSRLPVNWFPAPEPGKYGLVEVTEYEIKISPKAYPDDIAAFFLRLYARQMSDQAKAAALSFLDACDARAVSRHGYSSNPDEASFVWIPWTGLGCFYFDAPAMEV